jgi:hypothetical protein
LASFREASEIEKLRQQLGRYQLYLGVALAGIGLATLLCISVAVFSGLRLAQELAKTQSQLASLEASTKRNASELASRLARQNREIAAIRKAANDDLAAIEEANRKLAAIQDPAHELSALREANEALWSELASQRTQLVQALQDREGDDPETGDVVTGRFHLGQTRFEDPLDRSEGLKGFVQGDEAVYRATADRARPAHLLIELAPEEVHLGDAFRLAVRIVNRSNRPLDTQSLRLDWTFGDRNTGGDVPMAVARIDARASSVLYQLSGEWTPAHEQGPVSVTATLTLDGGQRLSNTLRW